MRNLRVHYIDYSCLNLPTQHLHTLHTGLLKSHMAQLRLAACGGKKGKKERDAAGGRPPRHALSFLWGGVGNTFGDF